MKKRKTIRKMLSFVLMVAMLFSQTVQSNAQEGTGVIENSDETQVPDGNVAQGSSAAEDADVSGGDISGGDVSGGDASISGMLWLDVSSDASNNVYYGNGVYDAGEKPLAGYLVSLYEESDLTNSVSRAYTDASGNYTFSNLTPGTYVVGVKSEDIGGVSYLLPLHGISGDNKFVLSTADYVNAYSAPIVIIEGTVVTGINAGMRTPPGIMPLSGGYLVGGSSNSAININYPTLEAAFNAINGDSTSSSYTVTVTMTDTSMGNMAVLAAGNNVVLTSLGGATITQDSSNERHIRVNGSLTLDNVILDGNATGGGISVQSGGSLVMNSGAVIQNCFTTTAREGGGVYVVGGDLTMNNGAVIQNCGVVSNGQSMGGGVNITNESTFTMNSGATIQDCYVNSSGGNYTYGGGVYLNYGSEFIMNGGTIRNNTALCTSSANWTAGGGVFIGQPNTSGTKASTFTMSGGTITGNTVGGAVGNVLFGGGVALMNGAVFNMSGGTVSGNQVDKVDDSSAFGGGVGLYSTGNTVNNFTMSGGNITNNSVVNNSGNASYVNVYGGGIGLFHDSASASTSLITVTNGTISGNSAIYGGGIYTESHGKVQINNGSITGNTASTDGGGIYTTQSSYANPVASGSYANLTISGSVNFSGNSAADTYGPPVNAAALTNIDSASTSIATVNHILNNYDVNYRGAYTVTYKPNGGTGSDFVVPATNIGSGLVTVLGLSVTGISAKPGYTFVAWSTEADGIDTSKHYGPAEMMYITGNTILYAIWEADFTGFSLTGGSKTYDGTSSSATLSGTLQTGDVVQYYADGVPQSANPTFTDAGSYLVEAKITRGTESITLNAYVVISKAAISVTTASDGKLYDGTALTETSTANNYITGLVSGETVTFTVTGSQTNVGSSANTYTLTWNGTAKEGNYNVTAYPGTLTVTKNTGNTIIMRAGTASKLYDGTALVYNNAVVDSGTLASGHTAHATVVGSQTNVGGSANVVTQVRIEDATGNDVTGNYQLGTHIAGTLTVNLDTSNTIVVTAGSTSKYYDGTPLTYDNYTQTGGTLAAGHVVKAYITGSRTSVGTMPNVVSYVWIEDATGNDVTSNYVLGTHIDGLLKVEKDPSNILVFAAGSSGKAYDGTALTDGTCVLISGNLGSTLTAYPINSGSQTNVGSSSNIITSLRILDSSNIDVTSNYVIGTFVAGTLTVTKDYSNPIIIEAGSAGKVYDGTALTDSSSTLFSGTLVSGHTWTATTGGTQTNVGNSANIVTNVVIRNALGIDVTSNYAVGPHVDGALSVTLNYSNPIIVTTGSANKTYDGTPLTQSSAVHTGGTLLAGHTMVAITTGGSQTNVGSSFNTVASILITDTGGNDVTGNYVLGPHILGNLVVTVNPANIIAVKADDASKLYDGTALTSNAYTLLTGTLISGHTLSINAGGSQINVGSSSNPVLSIKIEDAQGNDVTANYLQGSHMPGTLTVNVDTTNVIVVKAGSLSKPYDGTALTDVGNTSELVGGTLGPGHTVHVTTAGSQTTVGSSANTITSMWIEDAGGVDITVNYYIGSYQQGVLTVNKAQVTVTTDSASKSYDGTALTAATANYSGLQNGETFTYSVTGSQLNAGSSVNTYTIVWNGTASQTNYDIVENLGTLTVTKAALSVTTASDSKTYDGTALTAPTGTYSGLQNSETISFTVTGSRLNAGSSDNTYAIVWNGTANQNNYEVTGTLGTLTVNKAAVIVTTSSNSKTYDGIALTEGGITYSGLVNNEAFTIRTTGSRKDAGSSANTYTIVWDKTALESNYSVTDTLGTLTVNPKAITITTGSANKAYDSTPLTAAGSNVSGLVTGETLTVKTSGSQTNVGSSSNSYTLVWGSAKAGNYYVAGDTLGTLEVTYAAVTVTANNVSKGYGQKDPAFTAAVTGTYNNDSITYSLSRSAGEDCKTYQIMPTGAQIQGNYKVTYLAGSLSIVPDKNNVITITSKSASKEYDATPLTEAGYSYTGTLHGRDYLVASTSGSLQNVGTVDNVVTFRILRGNRSGEVDVTSYYVTETVYGSLTVTPKEAYLIANDCSKIYGEGNPNFSATITGLVGDDTVEYTLVCDNATNVGSYRIEVKDAYVGNYKLITVAGTLSVTPRAVTVYGDYLIQAYGAADIYLSATAVGLLGGDTLSYTVTRTPGGAIGTYVTTVSGPELQGGYAVTYVNGMLAITADGTIATMDPETAAMFKAGQERIGLAAAAITTRSPKTGVEDSVKAMGVGLACSLGSLLMLLGIYRKRRRS